jgi:hypothetical protein
MYDPFFKEGLLAYVELCILIVLFTYCFYRKRKFFIKNYAYKLNTLLKVIIFILLSIFNVIVLTFLYYNNVHWIIGVAYNALSITLNIVLSIAIFFYKKV